MVCGMVLGALATNAKAAPFAVALVLTVMPLLTAQKFVKQYPTNRFGLAVRKCARIQLAIYAIYQVVTGITIFSAGGPTSDTAMTLLGVETLIAIPVLLVMGWRAHRIMQIAKFEVEVPIEAAER